MNKQPTLEEQESIDRIYRREMKLIKEGKDPETAHAIAVAEASLPELEHSTIERFEQE